MKKLIIFLCLLWATGAWGYDFNFVTNAETLFVTGNSMNLSGTWSKPDSIRLRVYQNATEVGDNIYGYGSTHVDSVDTQTGNDAMHIHISFDSLDGGTSSGIYQLYVDLKKNGQDTTAWTDHYSVLVGYPDVNMVSSGNNSITVNTLAGNTITNSKIAPRAFDMTKFDTASVAAFYKFVIWLDDNASNTNSVVGVDGTPQNPVSTLAAARILADSMGLNKYYITNNSSFTLDAAYEDWEFIGIGEGNLIDLGSQDVDNSHFEHLMISGTQGGASIIGIHGSYLNTIDSLEGIVTGSSYSDTISLRVSGNTVFDQCYSHVAGNATPGLDFNSTGTIDVDVRHYSGGLALFNMTSGHTISYEADGQLVIDGSSTSGNVTARGNMDITDNGTTTSLTDNAVFNKSELVDDTWDEVLTGATHNVATSAGRRLRQLETGQILLTGTINTANDSTATLDLSGAYDDDFFVHNWLVVTVGTDSVQIRSINGYTGATDSVDMAAGESWVVTPSNGDEWEIVASASVNVADLHQVVLDEIWEDPRPDTLLSPYRAGGFNGDFTLGGGIFLDSLRIINSNGYAVYLSSPTHAFYAYSSGGGDGMRLQSAGGSGHAFNLVATSGNGLNAVSSSGNDIDGDITGGITGNITGNLSGSVNSVATTIDANIKSADTDAFDSTDFHIGYWHYIADYSDSGGASSGLDSGSVDNIMDLAMADYGVNAGKTSYALSNAANEAIADSVLKDSSSYQGAAAGLDSAAVYGAVAQHAADSGVVVYSGSDNILQLRGLHIRGTAGNDTSFIASGYGAGIGMFTVGGATGHGFYGKGGATSGHGFTSLAPTSGYGMYVKGKGNSFHGLRATGDGMGAHGILGDALGGGTSVGIGAAGGTDGHGFYGLSGASGGVGGYFLCQATNGAGLSAAGAGTGAGFLAQGGSSTGAGIEAIKGAGGIDIEGSLEGIVHDGDSILTQSDLVAGTGPYACSIYVKSGATFLDDINVKMISSGGESWQKHTNTSGLAVLSLNASTYKCYVSGTAAYSQDTIPQTFVISADFNDTVTMTALTPTAPTSDDYVTMYVNVHDFMESDTVSGVELSITPNRSFRTTGGWTYFKRTMSAQTNDTGYAEIIVLRSSEAIPTASGISLTYRISLKKQGYIDIEPENKKYIAPDSSTHRIQFYKE